MQIELIGCTGAGKSTLASCIVASGHARGIEVVRSDDFVLDRLHLNWVKRRLPRMALMDVISLWTCLVTWRAKPGLYPYVFRVLAGLRRTPRLERLNVARNVLKKIGIHEIIRRHAGDERIVLVDEGSLQAAHNLFVHCSVAVNPGDVARFARLVPLPDIAVYVREHEPVLVARTMARGHNRIPGQSSAKVQVFIRRAVETFELLARQPRLADRLVVVSPGDDVKARADEGDHPARHRALEIVRAGVSLRVERQRPAPRRGPARGPSTQGAGRLIRNVRAFLGG
jgi:hypothetical protein